MTNVDFAALPDSEAARLMAEMDRRGWLMWRKDHKNYSDVTLFDKHGAIPGDGCAALPHVAVLKAFYDAHHADGDNA